MKRMQSARTWQESDRGNATAGRAHRCRQDGVLAELAREPRQTSTDVLGHAAATVSRQASEQPSLSETRVTGQPRRMQGCRLRRGGRCTTELGCRLLHSAAAREFWYRDDR